MSGRLPYEHGLRAIDVLRHIAFPGDSEDDDERWPVDNDWGVNAPNDGKAREDRSRAATTGWEWAKRKAAEESVARRADYGPDAPPDDAPAEPGDAEFGRRKLPWQVPDFSWVLNQATGGLPCASLSGLNPRAVHRRPPETASWLRDPLVDPPENDLPQSGHPIWDGPSQVLAGDPRMDAWLPLQVDLPSLNRRAGLILIPPGVFYLDEPIYLYPGQVLRGAGTSVDRTTGECLGGTRLVLRGPRAQIVGGRTRLSASPSDTPVANGNWNITGTELRYRHGTRWDLVDLARNTVVIEEMAILERDRKISPWVYSAIDLANTHLFRLSHLVVRRADQSHLIDEQGTEVAEADPGTGEAVQAFRHVGVMSSLNRPHRCGRPGRFSQDERNHPAVGLEPHRNAHGTIGR